MKAIKFARSAEEWTVLGERRRTSSDGEVVLVEDELAEIRASDLRRELASEADLYAVGSSASAISLVPIGYVDFDYGPYSPIRFEWDGGMLTTTFSQQVQWPADGDEGTAISDVRLLLAPLLAASRSSLRVIESDDRFSDPQFLFLAVTIETPYRGRTLADLYSVAEDAMRLCDAFAESTITRQTVANLVRGGAAHLLVGQPEGNWLDAKSQEYDLKTLDGKISLAQAVARFCNGEDGGLIVIGAKAKKVPGGEVISKVGGVPAAPGRDVRYRQVLDHHLYPPPLGLRIDLVPAEDGLSFILIDIPPQGEELKPFLVHGAIRSDNQAEGTFISIVQRRGEGSIPITAPMIHASLAAGRALLRGMTADAKT
ncbi:hypothetical protein [Gordonia tangerina]|uniref:Schlafen AlbA-2 domain-containing protein n=1 Tax=Gordonia tangerina TaxID=2911060 RepID=A0ABS9DKG8_9ACTN|nr:hypothetical protein [Gordonia tangerina]MCF3939566.1 hypothetical protein [Gordonia tangerina]